MLVLKRKEGQWVEIIHRSGDVIRLRVYDIQSAAGSPSRANLAFDDAARNFEIRRPERRLPTPKPVPGMALVSDTEADASAIGPEPDHLVIPVADAVVSLDFNPASITIEPEVA